MNQQPEREPKDRVVKAMSPDHGVRVVVASSTATVREACRLQDAVGLEAIVLARALTTGALMSTLTKLTDERVRLHFRGDGPVGSVLVDAHGDGRVRACLEKRLGPEHTTVADASPSTPDSGPTRASVHAVVGTEGHLVVTRDVGLRQPYQGTVDLRSGEIDEDAEHYLGRSEQLPSALRVGVSLDASGAVRAAAGVLCQALPESPPMLIQQCRTRLAGSNLEALLHEVRGAKALASFAIGGAEPRFMGEQALRFHCPCGPARARSVLSSLGASDLRALAGEQAQTDVSCHFCGRVTRLARSEVLDLAAELEAARS